MGEETLQRVRLSPSERRLAATIKTPHQEEARCIVVQLTDMTTAHLPLLILDNVFSFGKRNDHRHHMTSVTVVRKILDTSGGVWIG